jgi:hypothetical protein
VGEEKWAIYWLLFYAIDNLYLLDNILLQHGINFLALFLANIQGPKHKGVNFLAANPAVLALLSEHVPLP